MSENLRYENELQKRLNDLSLPDEDMAWQDMKRRLEKKDDDKPVIPPLLKGCGSLALLLLLLITVLWLIKDPTKWFDDKIKNEKDKTENIENRKEEKVDNKERINSTKNKSTLKNATDLIKKTILPGSTSYSDSIAEIKSLQSKTIKDQKNYIAAGTKNTGKNNRFNKQNNTVIVKNKRAFSQTVTKISNKPGVMPGDNAQTDTVKNAQPNPQIEKQEQANAKDDTADISLKTKAAVDSLKKPADAVSNSKKSKSDSSERRNIYFGAGLALHQLVPVAGQKSNPYNSLGRKSSLGDYIPSVFLRMYKDKKWFVQSEFRYGAPQYTKEILFREIKVIDTFGTFATTSGKRVKKTFYHQLPVSFNYFAFPGFSIGAGVTFNKFKSALVEESTNRTNLTTQTDSLIGKGLVSQKKADSNFVKSYMQALIEVQYQWKRFSAGARYSFGLQPYLKFKLPGGEQRTERNSALQLFIRYDIWQSEKRK